MGSKAVSEVSQARFPATPSATRCSQSSDEVCLSVVNVEGTLLGKVKELEIGDQDGCLIKLEVHRGGVLGIGGTTVTVALAAIRGIGPKLITVDMPAEEGEQQPKL